MTVLEIKSIIMLVPWKMWSRSSKYVNCNLLLEVEYHAPIWKSVLAKVVLDGRKKIYNHVNIVKKFIRRPMFPVHSNDQWFNFITSILENVDVDAFIELANEAVILLWVILMCLFYTLYL